MLPARLILLIAFVSSPPHVQAQDVSCPAMGNLAQAVMMLRQTGATVFEVMQVVAQTQEPMRSISAAIIEEAYKRPQLRTDDSRSQAIGAFREEMEQICDSVGH